VELTGAKAIRNEFTFVLNRRGDMKKLTAFIPDWVMKTAITKYTVIAVAGFKRFPRSELNHICKLRMHDGCTTRVIGEQFSWFLVAPKVMMAPQ